jgi:hypothetical protein
MGFMLRGGWISRMGRKISLIVTCVFEGKGGSGGGNNAMKVKRARTYA